MTELEIKKKLKELLKYVKKGVIVNFDALCSKCRKDKIYEDGLCEDCWWIEEKHKYEVGDEHIIECENCGESIIIYSKCDCENEL